MTRLTALGAAMALALSPAFAFAAGQGSINGQGWDHLNGPSSPTGQPGASCEETPTTPGNAESASGSAFNPDGTAGGVYAGEQLQNQRNTASVSQYDVACTKQPG